MQTIELTVDVTDAADLGAKAHTAVTVYLPDLPLSPKPVVCFAFPGGGYSRHYYAMDVMGDTGGQAGFHTSKGWIFVSCDHLGVGDSTVPDGNVLDYDNVARANLATVNAVMEKLKTGSLSDNLEPVENATLLGIGQSMGGCFTLVLQGRYAPFDGVGILGYSAIHTVVPSRPGTAQASWPWMTHDSDLSHPLVANQAAINEAERSIDTSGNVSSGEHPFAWSFHFEDVPEEIVTMDLNAKAPDGSLPYWRSATTPGCAIRMVSPGTVAPEAASIRVPVLVANGERDVVPDPWMEPKAYKSCNDITVYNCPKMGHMHNFASTRREFWQRLHNWGEGIQRMKV